jgi:hypothetical protein
VGGVGATLPISITTTVVLEFIKKLIDPVCYSQGCCGRNADVNTARAYYSHLPMSDLPSWQRS